MCTNPAFVLGVIVASHLVERGLLRRNGVERAQGVASSCSLIFVIEPGWTGRIVDDIASTGKPVIGFSIERNGGLKTTEAASRKAQEYVQWASELAREECSLLRIARRPYPSSPRVWVPPGISSESPNPVWHPNSEEEMTDLKLICWR
jgi:hypothetical protein